MRFFPVLTAIVVCVALFFVVLERDALLSFARGATGDEDGEVSGAAERIGEGPVAIAAMGASDAAEPVHVVALRSVAREVPDAVMVRGQSEAARQVTVMPETSGSVISDPIRKGAFVERGDVLCELDPGSRMADVTEAEARLAEARARLPEAEARVPEAEARKAEAEAQVAEARLNQTAASRLAEGGFAADTRVLNAAAALRSAEASVTAAQTNLETVQAGIEAARAGIEAAEATVERTRLEIDKLTIEAPFSGLLETDTAELGALMVMTGSNEGACATIVQLDPMKLVGFLPEAQVDRVTVGAAARARLASGAETQGNVTFLSRAADDLTRTFRVEVTVPNPDLAIRDGQTAEIVIETPTVRAHLIPASAMTLDDAGTLGVRVVRDGMADFMPVTLLRDTVDGVYLTGLPDMLDVITVGQEYVTDGVPVRASYAEDGASVEGGGQ